MWKWALSKYLAQGSAHIDSFLPIKLSIFSKVKIFVDFINSNKYKFPRKGNHSFL